MSFDRQCKWTTILSFIFVASVVGWNYFTSSGSYLPAWLAIVVTTMLLTISLQLPRSILLTDTHIELNGLLNIHRIARADIVEVKLLPKGYSLFPVFGSWGFLGYFGYCYDFKQKRIIRLFASRRTNLFLIKSKHQRDTIISVGIDSETFLKTIFNQ